MTCRCCCPHQLPVSILPAMAGRATSPETAPGSPKAAEPAATQACSALAVPRQRATALGECVHVKDATGPDPGAQGPQEAGADGGRAPGAGAGTPWTACHRTW